MLAVFTNKALFLYLKVVFFSPQKTTEVKTKLAKKRQH